VNLSSISAGIVIILALAILIFLIFTRRQIMNAFFPNRAKAQPKPPTLSIDQLLTRAYARRDTGDQRGALHDFEEILQRAPSHPEATNIRQEIINLR
jgi:hypothetical protein